MPLPIIIGAAALATAAYGAKKGYDGYQKHSEADEIVKSAKSRYERKKLLLMNRKQKLHFSSKCLEKKS